jgi:hypothetical protein
VHSETLEALGALLRDAYNISTGEEGYSTLGHQCITEKDKLLAVETGASLLFGEFLPIGVDRAFDSEHLNASQAHTVVDLGMGLGKLLLQVFLQYPHLKSCLGVELSPSRYQLGHAALERFVKMQENNFFVLEKKRNSIQIKNKKTHGILEFRSQNLFEVDIREADIVVLETNIPDNVWPKLRKYLKQMKQGARILTYEDLNKVYGEQKITQYFSQLPINHELKDRFNTTWSPTNGHHFFIWTRVS